MRRPIQKGNQFWNKEYRTKGHLALSDNPSEDLIKFTRFLEKEYGKKFLNSAASALDLGCGNGRNLIYLAKTFGIKGVGIDISSEAISLAKKLSEKLPIQYHTESIASSLPLPSGSQTLVLDMMTSHFLKKTDRENVLLEILRVLRPGGWLFWKTFLLDEDLHAKRLLKEHPALEEGSYIHPQIGEAEHVFTEEEIAKTLEEHFFIHKIYKSHRHLNRGKPWKRRSVSVYAEKIL
jgi:SAM-dependent methyltransferase